MRLQLNRPSRDFLSGPAITGIEKVSLAGAFLLVAKATGRAGCQRPLDGTVELLSVLQARMMSRVLDSR